MAVPKKKKSKSKTRSHRPARGSSAARRAASARAARSAKLPHVVCPTCGWYKNRVVVDVG